MPRMAMVEPPLHIAIGRRRIVMVEDLVANGADVNIRDINGRSPLMMAEESCYSDLYRRDRTYIIIYHLY